MESLRLVRRLKGLSLQDVQRLTHCEFKASVLGAYERGERQITVQRLVRLAEVYDVPAAELLPEGPTHLADHTRKVIQLTQSMVNSLLDDLVKGFDNA